MVRHQFLVLAFGGSNPSPPAKHKHFKFIICYSLSMNYKKLILGAVVILLMLGLFVPVNSYTTIKGCPTDKTPIKRLNLILGDTIGEIKKGDVEPLPNVGCSINTKYVLYLL